MLLSASLRISALIVSTSSFTPLNSTDWFLTSTPASNSFLLAASDTHEISFG